MKTILHGITVAWRWYASQFKGRWFQRVAVSATSLIVSFFLYIGAVDVNLFGLFGMSPTMEAIQNPITNEASLVYSADSVLLGKFFNENRSPVQFEDISPYVIDALISTEDERFYQHHGIDWQGLFAALKDIARGNPRGASTITQQLVKNLFKMRSQYSTGALGKVPGVKMLIMKTKEWITAVKIENMYSKKDILTLYLNTVDFGSNSFGIKTAAKTYFKTTPQNLTADQAAILVGLLKATTTYNPKVHPDKSLERRNVVLGNMLSHKKLTKQEYDSLSTLPINLIYTVENSYDGQALYFREAVKDYLSDWCKRENIDLYSDGLKIYTTLDSRMQRYAEQAVGRQMRIIQKRFNDVWGTRPPWRDQYHQEIPNFIEGIAKRTDYYKALNKRFDGNEDSIFHYLNLPHQVKLFDYNTPKRYIVKEMSTMDSIRYMVRFMHSGLVAMEPHTSHVKAWVGDLDFNSWKYDKVTAMRQPGSTFKLFVYSSAFENDDEMTPTKHYVDSYISMKVPDAKSPDKTTIWTPHNADGVCTNQSMTLKRAFALSVNTIAVKVGQDTGIDNIVEIARKMGVRSKLDPTPSLALGSSDVTLLELATAYSTVMNDGMAHRPVLVTKVIDRDGTVIYDCDKDEEPALRAMKYKTAFYMQRMLYSGVNEGGTSSSLRWQWCPNFHDVDLGGKTGTSNNHSDAWFVACTPRLVVGSWVGGEYRCIHFQTGAQGQGNKTALPVVGDFMKCLLCDPAYQAYHQKFPEAKEAIPAASYQDYGTPILVETDSTDIDETIPETDQPAEDATPPAAPED